MLFIIISKYILGSAGFATAIIIFLSMVAWIVPRPGLGTSGVPVAKDPFGFQKDFTDCICLSNWTVFSFLCSLFGLSSTNFLGCTSDPLTINCLVHRISFVWFCFFSLTYLYCIWCCLSLNSVLMVSVNICYQVACCALTFSPFYGAVWNLE